MASKKQKQIKQAHKRKQNTKVNSDQNKTKQTNP